MFRDLPRCFHRLYSAMAKECQICKYRTQCDDGDASWDTTILHEKLLECLDVPKSTREIFESLSVIFPYVTHHRVLRLLADLRKQGVLESQVHQHTHYYSLFKKNDEQVENKDCVNSEGYGNIERTDNVSGPMQ